MIEALHTLTCGLFHIPLDAAAYYAPQFLPIIKTAPRVGGSDRETILDVKIHMLMPGQYPCIPNWHCDFTPRDENGKKMPDERDSNHRMAILLSGPPFTEFRDGRQLTPWEWSAFTQFDEHRGTPSDAHCWRLFARVVPRALCEPAPPEQWHRRHTQVYLDAGAFEW